MGVPVSDVDTLMAYAVGDGNGGEAHVDQQAHMAVPLWYIKDKPGKP